VQLFTVVLAQWCVPVYTLLIRTSIPALLHYYTRQDKTRAGLLADVGVKKKKEIAGSADGGLTGVRINSLSETTTTWGGCSVPEGPSHG